ncbi:hypothetical protein EON81_03430 [bacterium]|nr:MAG: hypothetical protein EON81_03430 [bacterium]
MIREYGDSLPPLQTKARRKAPSRKRWGMVALASAFVGAAVILTAPSAEARAMGEMRDALNDVRSLHARISIRYGSRRSRLVSETWMKDGVWCFESRKGTPSHASWILKGERQYMNDLVRGVSTVEPRAGVFYSAKTALGFVIEQTDTGPMGIDRKTTRTEGPMTNGRATYQLVLWKAREEAPRENSRTVILVDAKTNLPIWSETTTNLPEMQTSVERSEYEFNVPIFEKQFKPPFEPVIDLAEVQLRLVKEWRQKPVAKAGSATLLDVQMNPEGALFVLFEGTAAPKEVVAADGTRYLQAIDYRPGGTWGDTGTQKRCEGVRGTVFVPVTLKAPARPRFRIGTGNRGFQNPGSSQTDLKSGGTPGTAEVEAKLCPDWPDYRFEMMLALFFTNVDPRMASTQAAYLAKQGDVDGAVERYRLAYERMKGFISSVAYRELVPAEQLLRSKGRIAEADALSRTMAKDRAVDPNVPSKPTP